MHFWLRPFRAKIIHFADQTSKMYNFWQNCVVSWSCCNLCAPWANLNFKTFSGRALSKLLKMGVVSKAPTKSTWVHSLIKNVGVPWFLHHADGTTCDFWDCDFRRWITSFQLNFQNLPSAHTPTFDSVPSTQVHESWISSKFRGISHYAHSLQKCWISVIFTFCWSNFGSESGALALI